MNSSLFYKSFAFCRLRHQEYHCTDARKGSPMHFVAYMLKGRCKITSRYYNIEAKAGDVFYIPMNLPYQSYWYGDELISLGFSFFDEAKSKKFYLQNISCPDKIKEMILNPLLISGINSKSIGHFYTTLSELISYMKYEDISKEERIVSDATEYMELHPKANADEISRYANISETALYTAFKKVTGITPNDAKQKILCEKAEILLTTTDKSVQEISDALGFSSTSYFRKILHKTLNKTPREIRKENNII